MIIYLGTDHAGFELKEKLKIFLQELGHEVKDLGAHSFNPKDDYPDFIRPVAEAVQVDKESRGIVLGGSGQGEAIVANRIKGIRAVVYYGSPTSVNNHEIVELSRRHNNANILSLGARFISEKEAKKAVKLWLETPFSGDERHKRRINKIEK